MLHQNDQVRFSKPCWQDLVKFLHRIHFRQMKMKYITSLMFHLTHLITLVCRCPFERVILVDVKIPIIEWLLDLLPPGGTRNNNNNNNNKNWIDDSLSKHETWNHFSLRKVSISTATPLPFTQFEESTVSPNSYSNVKLLGMLTIVEGYITIQYNKCFSGKAIYSLYTTPLTVFTDC